MSFLCMWDQPKGVSARSWGEGTSPSGPLPDLGREDQPQQAYTIPRGRGPTSGSLSQTWGKGTTQGGVCQILRQGDQPERASATPDLGEQCFSPEAPGYGRCTMLWAVGALSAPHVLLSVAFSFIIVSNTDMAAWEQLRFSLDC